MPTSGGALLILGNRAPLSPDKLITNKNYTMEIMDYFKRRQIRLADLGRGKGYISSVDLLDLIRDIDVKKYVIEKYDLDAPIDIKFDKVDILTPLVKQYVDRFEQLRLLAAANDVSTGFANNEHPEVIFTIKNGTFDDQVEIDELNAIAKYDSVSMFYEKRKLSQYITFLSKNVRNKGLLDAVNTSWQDYYEKNEITPENKVFRLLRDKEEDVYYVKSISSAKFREFGVGETFAISVLELARISNLSEDSFSISSLALSESKIDMIINTTSKKLVPELGYVSPSIAIRNEDQGNASFGLYSTLEFQLSKLDKDGKLHFFPKRKQDNIKTEKVHNHLATTKTFVDSYREIQKFLTEADNFEKDYFFMKEANKPDHLRAKIEEKIVSNRSPFKGIKEVKDLFTRESVGYIDNLAKLLELCGKVELIDMDYDLKFKLRYLISDVLLYGKNDMQ